MLKRKRHMMMTIRQLVFGLAVAFALPAFAQTKEVVKKTTEYSFEDDTIEGDLSKPDGEYVEARKKVKHSNLIKIREEFKDKVLQSVGEL
jgi:uncharacterized protein YabN with tetrapyrrole methylase and pyrophosphatase domain